MPRTIDLTLPLTPGARGVAIVEGLAYLDQLTHPRVFFHSLPLKLAAGDGCPVRAFAYDSSPEMWPRD